MIDTIKSKLEDAFKEATEGVSGYTLFSILIYTTFIHFHSHHPEQAICSLLNTDLSNIIGENSYILKVKIKELLLATTTTLAATFIVNALRSEYFDLLYETILKNYISALKNNTHPHSNTNLDPAIKTFRKNCNIQNTAILITGALATIYYIDSHIYYSIAFIISTILITFYSIHTSAKQLISRILPAIISNSPEISRDELDKLFSKPNTK